MAKKNGDLAVQYLPLDDLEPYPNNPRTHSDAQVAQIAASIKEFGWTNPILVDGHNGVVAGHGRLLAAKSLGMGQVPVIELTGLTATQKRAYILADNKLAENAGWDFDRVAVEFGELKDVGFDVEVIGFGVGEVAGFAGTGGSAEDEWQGMPEFHQEDKTAFRSIVVHLKDQDAVDAFAVAVAHNLTENTKFIWYPKIEIETYVDKHYSDKK